MSKHYSLKPARCVVEFRPSNKASAHGGQLAVVALLTPFDLWRLVREEPALDPRSDNSKGFDPEVYVATFLFGFTSGGVSLSDGGRLDEDESLKALLGLEKVPDQSSLGEWLRNIGEPGWLALRRLQRQLAQWVLKHAKKERLLLNGQLECFFDDSPIEVKSDWFEGAALNDEGKMALSWQALWVGPLMVDGVLGATSQRKESMASPAGAAAGHDVSNQLPALLEANRALWKEFSTYCYTDSASSAGKYLTEIAATFDHWSVSYNKWTGPLEKTACELPESAWSTKETVHWRDGTEHDAQYAWCRHQPSGCATAQCFAVVRHRQAGELFWRYAFITCEERAGEAKSVFERHRLKGDYERRLSELLGDFQLHHPPCKELAANNCFYTLASLAYNIVQALKLLYLPDSEQPKRVRTLIHHLLLMPVEIGQHARQLKASLYSLRDGWHGGEAFSKNCYRTTDNWAGSAPAAEERFEAKSSERRTTSRSQERAKHGAVSSRVERTAPTRSTKRVVRDKTVPSMLPAQAKNPRTQSSKPPAQTRHHLANDRGRSTCLKHWISRGFKRV